MLGGNVKSKGEAEVVFTQKELRTLFPWRAQFIGPNLMG